MDVTSYVISSVMAMAQSRIEQEKNIAVIKKTMDVQEAQGMALVEMLNSVPRFNRLLDTYG